MKERVPPKQNLSSSIRREKEGFKSIRQSYNQWLQEYRKKKIAQQEKDMSEGKR